MDEDFYAQRILNAYDNVRWDLWEVPDPTEEETAFGSPPQEPVQEETKTPKEKPKKKAKGALS